MNKERIEELRVKNQMLIKEKRESILKKFRDSDLYSEKELAEIEKQLDDYNRLPYNIIPDTLEQIEFMYCNVADDLFDYRSACFYNPDRYLDSEPVRFDGDIIITDPCYIIDEDDDWQKSGYGEDLSMLGLKHWMSRDTIYGDWSCTVYNEEGNELGNFCADSGMVCVADLSEILAYNPEFDYHTAKTWTTAWIENFSGTVRFVVHEDKNDIYLELEGEGTADGKPIKFVARQTGL